MAAKDTFMTRVGISPSLMWFHNRYIFGFTLNKVKYFSANHIAEELGFNVVGDFDLVRDILPFCPFVLPDRTYGLDHTPDMFMPLPQITQWICQRDIEEFSDDGREWFKVIWEQVTEILDSPTMQKAAMDLIEEMRAHGDEPS